MKIEKIEIYGYGKWLQKEFASINKLQIFKGDNEAGKSTISSFIHTMFFGFPSTRKKDFNTYRPKRSDTYGGRIALSGTRFGTVTIERLKERNRGKATLTHQNGEQEVVGNLASYLLGVNEETYDLLYTFDLERLLELNKIKKDDLNRYLLGVGTSGSEKILLLADEYRKDAQKIFKPTGTIPSLNKKIKELDDRWQQLQKAKQENSQYERLLLTDASLQEQIEEAHSQQGTLENENKDLSEAIRLNDYYQEWLKLNKEINLIDASALPKDARNQWERLQHNISDGLQKLTVIQEKIKAERKILAEYTHTKWYQETKPQWQAVQHDFSRISSQFNQKTFLEKQYHEEKLAMNLFKQRYQLKETASFEELNGQKEAEAKTLLETEEKLHAHLNHTKQELNSSEKEQQQLEKRIQTEKTNLVSEETFQSWRKQADKPTKPVKSNSQKKMNVLATLAVLALVLAFFFPSIRFYAGFVTVMLGMGVLVQQRQITINKKSTQKESFNLDTYIQQATLRGQVTDWQAILKQEEHSFIKLLDQQESIEMDLTANKEKQTNWLKQENYPNTFTIQQVLTEKPAERFRELTEELEKTEKAIQAIDNDLKAWEEQTYFIKKQLSLEHLTAYEFLSRFTELHQAIILEESMADNSKQKLAALKVDETEVQQALNENQQKRQHLLAQAKVSNEPEFYHLLHAKEEQVEQKRRRDFLGEQINGKEVLLEKFSDKEKATKRLMQNQNRLEDIQSKLKELQTKHISLKHEIQILEEGGTYSSLLQNYALVETQMREMIISWASKVVAAEWLENTLRHGKENRLPLILSDMTSYFKRLTDDAYTRIVFQKSGLKIQHENGTVFQPFELSQGTIEQLYIAMRFAFIKNTADIANLPILIDDGFVNFDPTRKKVMYQLMAELSQNVQVFLFTFDDEIEEIFTPEQIYMLN